MASALRTRLQAPASSARAPLRVQPAARRLTVAVRAEGRSSGDSFVTGFLVGGVVFGALGFLLAPQISKTLLRDDQRLKLPRFQEEDRSPEATKEDLIEKIAQLNQSIDEVAAKLNNERITQEIGAN